MATPTTITKNSEPRPATQPTATKDPRIDSPEIKVVYPAEPKPAINISDRGIVKPQTQPKVQTEPAQEKDPVPTTTTGQPAQQTATTDTAPPTKIPLWDAVKQNMAWCVLIAVGLVAIGFFIGKKQAS